MLDGWEWLIIGAIAIVVILWGPAKIPEFAKSLGRAKGEFDKAQKEFSDAAKADTSAQQTTTNVIVPPARIRTNDEILLDTAQRLGIQTDGKTRSQISDEISLKARSLSAA